MNFVKQQDGSYAEVGSISSIAGKVVDDTEDIGIPVSGVPPVKCEDYLTESECVAAGCYWYDDACHSKPEVPPVELPWLPILIAVGGVIAVIGVIFAIKR